MKRLIQSTFVSCLVVLLTLSVGSAQDETETSPASTNNPVTVTVRSFLVSTVGGEETFVEANEAFSGQVMEFRLTATNVGEITLPARNVKVTGPIPDTTQYVPDSATPSSDEYLLEGSSDAQNFAEPDANDTQTNYSILRWTLLSDMEPESAVELTYRVTVVEE